MRRAHLHTLKVTGPVWETALWVPLARGTPLHLSCHGDQIFLWSRLLYSNDPDWWTFILRCIWIYRMYNWRERRERERQHDQNKGKERDTLTHHVQRRHILTHTLLLTNTHKQTQWPGLGFSNPCSTDAHQKWKVKHKKRMLYMWSPHGKGKGLRHNWT